MDWSRGMRGLSLVAVVSGLGGWSHPGADPGHSKYSDLDQITPENVHTLKTAWRYRTGDYVASPQPTKGWKFQVTPIILEDRLIFCTPRNEIIALDPGRGREIWRYDPGVDDAAFPSTSRVCRGVTPWTDPEAQNEETCATRVLMTTIDRRLIAVDARNGRPCPRFGDNGQVRVQIALRFEDRPRALTFVSPPAVTRGVVLIGSAIPDGERSDAPSGKLRAFDARTGRPLWQWDPIPRNPDDPRMATWHDGGAENTGAANAWAPLSADDARGVFFVPTGSASPDYFGGTRPGLNRDANSVVALDALTGKRLWAFQTVHHDIWDYDVSAPPTLVSLETTDGPRDVVIQVTKMGFVFVLDRETGEPIFGVRERPTDPSDVAGEWSAPTQPEPILPKPVLSEDVTAFGVTPWDRGACQEQIDSLRHDGLFTPPSLEGTLVHPFSGGGMNWGGIAFHPGRQIMVVNTSDAAEFARLIPRQTDAAIEGQLFEQAGTPYILDRGLVRSPLGVPCTDPPWGRLHAIDLTTGDELWRVPLGTFEDIAPFGDLILPDGTPGLGGPLVTKTGVIFIGAAMDNYLRAFNLQSGEEIWRGRLPAGGQASPMTYAWQGRQYVVIAAGGHGLLGTTPGDSIVAFALDGNGRGPGLLDWWERPTPRLAAILAFATLILAALMIIWRRRRQEP